MHRRLPYSRTNAADQVSHIRAGSEKQSYQSFVQVCTQLFKWEDRKRKLGKYGIYIIGALYLLLLVFFQKRNAKLVRYIQEEKYPLSGFSSAQQNEVTDSLSVFTEVYKRISKKAKNRQMISWNTLVGLEMDKRLPQATNFSALQQLQGLHERIDTSMKSFTKNQDGSLFYDGIHELFWDGEEHISIILMNS